MNLIPNPLPDSIMDKLASPDPKERRSALQSINRSYNNSQVNQLLIQMLATEDQSSNRMQIAQILSERKCADAVKVLTHILLTDNNKSTRLKLVGLLGSMQDRSAVAALLTVLTQDKSMNVRASAARILGEWREPSAIQPLVDLLAQTRDRSCDPRYEGLRHMAAMALGQFGDPERLLPLIDDHAWVRKEAVEALGRTNDPRALEPLLSLARQGYEPAIKGLRQFQDPHVLPTLVIALNDLSVTHSKRNCAEEILKERNDPELLDALLARLQEPHLIGPVWESIRMLGEIGDQRASIPILDHVLAYPQWYLDFRRQDLNNYNYHVYEKNREYFFIVPTALSKLCIDRLFSRLLELLNAPTSAVGVRHLCARTLALLQRPESREPLLTALVDPRNTETIEVKRGESSVQEVVVDAIARIGE